jgi:hypothetical protein
MNKLFIFILNILFKIMKIIGILLFDYDNVLKISFVS